MTDREQLFIQTYSKLSEPEKELVLRYMLDMTGDSIKPYHTLQTAAGIIGVTYRTCLEYIRTDKLKAHKVGGKWAIYNTDLKEFMEGR